MTGEINKIFIRDALTADLFSVLIRLIRWDFRPESHVWCWLSLSEVDQYQAVRTICRSIIYKVLTQNQTYDSVKTQINMITNVLMCFCTVSRLLIYVVTFLYCGLNILLYQVEADLTLKTKTWIYMFVLRHLYNQTGPDYISTRTKFLIKLQLDQTKDVVHDTEFSFRVNFSFKIFALLAN